MSACVCVCVCVCVGVLNPDEFINAAFSGKLKVVVKYLSDGGDPNTFDEVQIHKVRPPRAI